jgi:CRP/FNR family transcriptional regulator
MLLNPPYQNINFEHNSFLFKNLNNDERQKLLQISRLKTQSKQQYLVMQDTPSNKLFNIVSGVAAVEKISSSGRKQIIAFLFSGDFVGLSHFDTYEYSIRSITEVTAYEFKRDNLSALAEELPTLKENLEEIYSLILSLSLEQVYLLGQLKACERVCFLITQMLKRIPEASAEQLDFPMTRTDIADYLGLTVETVSRSFSQLKRDGVISSMSPNSICILQQETLETLASID